MLVPRELVDRVRAPLPQNFANERDYDWQSGIGFNIELNKLLRTKMPVEQAKKIMHLMETSGEKKFGTVLRTMMSMHPPLILPEDANSIAKMAAKHGLPNDSVNRKELFIPISPEEAHQQLGEKLNRFTNASGLSKFEHEAAPPPPPYIRRDPSMSWFQG